MRSTYPEALLLANAPLPEAYELLIASVPQLFGTQEGGRVRAICMRHGRALAWALGANFDVGGGFGELVPIHLFLQIQIWVHPERLILDAIDEIGEPLGFFGGEFRHGGAGGLRAREASPSG